jgi:hypothetical protein
MYKSFKLNKNWSVAFEIFNKFCKEESKKNGLMKVFKTGIRNFDSSDHYTYSIVIGRFRIMFYKDKHSLNACN